MAYGWIGGPPGGTTAADRAERAPSLVVSAAHSAFGAVRRLQVRVGEVTVLLHPAPPGGGTGGQDRTAPLNPGTGGAVGRDTGGGTSGGIGSQDRAALPGHGAGGTGGDGRGRAAPSGHGSGGGVGPMPAPPPHHASAERWVRDGVVDDLDVGAHLATHLDLAGREDEVAGDGWSGVLPAGRYAALRRADPADAGTLAAVAGCPVELVRALADPVAAGRVEVVRRDGADRATGPTGIGTEELAWVDGGRDGLWTVRPGAPGEVRVDRGTPAGVAAELAGLVRAAEGC